MRCYLQKSASHIESGMQNEPMPNAVTSMQRYPGGQLSGIVWQLFRVHWPGEDGVDGSLAQ
jgi:hypothetical protein